MSVDSRDESSIIIAWALVSNVLKFFNNKTCMTLSDADLLRRWTGDSSPSLARDRRGPRASSTFDPAARADDLGLPRRRALSAQGASSAVGAATRIRIAKLLSSLSSGSCHWGKGASPCHERF